MKEKNQKKEKKSETQSLEELNHIKKESEEQKLPEQEKVFSISKKFSKLHNLPDPTNPPMGYEPNRGYDNVFPFIKLPFLHPKDSEDNISFGFGSAGYLDEKNKRHPLNAIYFGDNLQILRSLPSNCIDLIYIDPPFFSGRTYNQVWGITKDFYNKKFKEYEKRQSEIMEELGKHDRADKEHYITAEAILTLAQRAEEVFESSEVEEKRQLLNFLLQNLELKGTKLLYKLKTPFDTVLSANNCSDLLRGSDSNRQPTR